jgi:hypothetical protein
VLVSSKRATLQEWCELSVREKDSNTLGDRSFDRRQNFFAVASRASSDHRAYSRNLALLMDLSMEAEEFDLALDLGK